MGVNALHTMRVLPFPSPLHFLFHLPLPFLPPPVSHSLPFNSARGSRGALQVPQRVRAQAGHQTQVHLEMQ